VRGSLSGALRAAAGPAGNNWYCLVF
jgi:hypothetical protein